MPRPAPRTVPRIPPDASDYLSGPMPKYPAGHTFTHNGITTKPNNFQTFPDHDEEAEAADAAANGRVTEEPDFGE